MSRSMHDDRNPDDQNSTAQQWAGLAATFTAILSGFAALAAVLLSVHFYHLTNLHLHMQDARSGAVQAAQNATQIYRSYLAVTLEHPESFRKTQDGNTDGSAFVLTTAEALYSTTADPGWRHIVARVLSTHRELLESTSWDCSTINADFVSYVQRYVNLACTDTTH